MTPAFSYLLALGFGFISMVMVQMIIQNWMGSALSGVVGALTLLAIGVMI